jgi:hypothetical protein
MNELRESVKTHKQYTVYNVCFVIFADFDVQYPYPYRYP